MLQVNELMTEGRLGHQPQSRSFKMTEHVSVSKSSSELDSSAGSLNENGSSPSNNSSIDSMCAKSTPNNSHNHLINSDENKFYSSANAFVPSSAPYLADNFFYSNEYNNLQKFYYGSYHHHHHHHHNPHQQPLPSYQLNNKFLNSYISP